MSRTRETVFPNYFLKYEGILPNINMYLNHNPNAYLLNQCLTLKTVMKIIYQQFISHKFINNRS